MMPTVYSGDVVIVQKIFNSPPHFGQVVVVTHPTKPEVMVCKRILGMPGDIICRDPCAPDLEHVLIPPGHVWLMGDNSTHSTDSRVYGPVPQALIQGTAVLSVWPSIRRIQ